MQLASDSLTTMNSLRNRGSHRRSTESRKQGTAALHRSRRLALTNVLPSETCRNSKVLQEHDHETKSRKAVRKEERWWCRWYTDYYYTSQVAILLLGVPPTPWHGFNEPSSSCRCVPADAFASPARTASSSP